MTDHDELQEALRELNGRVPGTFIRPTPEERAEMLVERLREQGDELEQALEYAETMNRIQEMGFELPTVPDSGGAEVIGYAAADAARAAARDGERAPVVPDPAESEEPTGDASTAAHRFMSPPPDDAAECDCADDDPERVDDPGDELFGLITHADPTPSVDMPGPNGEMLAVRHPEWDCPACDASGMLKTLDVSYDGEKARLELALDCAGCEFHEQVLA